ncbi:MAG: ABC transporter ATP-binding protein, partial [Mobilicoccus sp.]|nr:ABC transporter ATP-binding protein [Mobilicoccus sp.]
MLLLSEPNVIVLDEPTNDVDADMLAATEDLLDSWPATLIVVSHDRYLLERVTDQQYAILDGRLRHVPGGVEEYLRLRAAMPAASVQPASASTTESPVSGADRRAAQKEINAIERRMSKVSTAIEKVHAKLAAHDQSDFDGLRAHTEELRALEEEMGQLEEAWLEQSEVLE